LAEETSEAQPPADIVVLGKIVDASGLRGAVKVHPFADDPQSWGSMPRWWLGHEGDPPESWRCLKLLQCREHSGVLVATLAGISDRNASEAVRGLLVGAPRAELPATTSGEYYWADLVGLEVVNTHDQMLGRVLGLIETAANDVLRVGDGEGTARLLPFVAAVVLDVDVPGRRIRVDWEADW
jgi:16S rRNA processing protein RimM